MLSHKQKGWLLTILIIMVLVLTGWGCLSHAHAGEMDAWEFKFFGINTKDFKDRKVIPVIVGGLSSFVIHELGHIAAAEITGMDASFDFDRRIVVASNYYDKSNDQKALYHAGGFIAQAIVGTALTVIPYTKHSDFSVGFTGFTFLNNSIYAITGGNQGDEASDVKNLDMYGYNGTATAAGFGLYSGILTYINIDKCKGE